MSRTLRRLRDRYEYWWVLGEWSVDQSAWIKLDRCSEQGRKALARFHSGKEVTMAPAPRWYRKVLDHQIRTNNDRIFRRWLADPDYEPVLQTWHKHNRTGVGGSGHSLAEQTKLMPFPARRPRFPALVPAPGIAELLPTDQRALSRQLLSKLCKSSSVRPELVEGQMHVIDVSIWKLVVRQAHHERTF